MDLQYAKQQFERYLDNYDRADDKVRLKIAHTYGVTECSRQIAERMVLSEEDCRLAQLIGLLHDIGRFEQIKRFDSFEPDVDETRISDSGFHAFLLCTDGFWEYVTEDEMEKTLYGSRDPEQWLWAMERYLKQKVPEDHDNYTAAAVFISQ